jgi:hypothetical protein
MILTLTREPFDRADRNRYAAGQSSLVAARQRQYDGSVAPATSNAELDQALVRGPSRISEFEED